MIIERLQGIANRAMARKPDFIIGGAFDPYMYRWWMIPRNRVFNIYLHQFFRSDDDRALHDHPWANLSIVLAGEYVEHSIAAGGVHERHTYRAGDWRFRPSGRIAHRIELVNGGCVTLFVTGPTYRQWGFHCPEAGWIPWKRFTASDDPGSIGKGCES